MTDTAAKSFRLAVYRNRAHGGFDLVRENAEDRWDDQDVIGNFPTRAEAIAVKADLDTLAEVRALRAGFAVYTAEAV